ncbi:Uncharacterised protein [Bacillus paralicheniformis]|nr:hypothetical protein DJ88_2467 [Bacillus paralicheniformis]GIN43498.1 hypothetical protein J23TS8_10650 [Bacillus paralicheniformis]GIN48080.1 hypothetical protein J25TS1_13340 [Bacillus paralicheniformis]GIN54431.1 hypothetical protein J36TS2_33250 [Bacillus paralicheniformis]VEB19349.1 Uncharacterised protein [Bacillus paralicheniformis]
MEKDRLSYGAVRKNYYLIFDKHNREIYILNMIICKSPYFSANVKDFDRCIFNAFMSTIHQAIVSSFYIQILYFIGVLSLTQHRLCPYDNMSARILLQQEFHCRI